MAAGQTGEGAGQEKRDAAWPLRRVIQIAAIAYGETEDRVADKTVIALCDDGSLWWHDLLGPPDHLWFELPKVPGT